MKDKFYSDWEEKTILSTFVTDHKIEKKTRKKIFNVKNPKKLIRIIEEALVTNKIPYTEYGIDNRIFPKGTWVAKFKLNEKGIEIKINIISQMYTYETPIKCEISLEPLKEDQEYYIYYLKNKIDEILNLYRGIWTVRPVHETRLLKEFDEEEISEPLMLRNYNITYNSLFIIGFFFIGIFAILLPEISDIDEGEACFSYLVGIFLIFFSLYTLIPSSIYMEENGLYFYRLNFLKFSISWDNVIRIYENYSYVPDAPDSHELIIKNKICKDYSINIREMNESDFNELFKKILIFSKIYDFDIHFTSDRIEMLIDIEHICPDCSESLDFIREYGSWYCSNCEIYVD